MRPATAPDPTDETPFDLLVERHRRELHVHCYRMLGSFVDAEDAVQDALLRAWDSRGSFTDGTNFRAWLYRIATNVCLDVLRRRQRQVRAFSSFAEVPWLQPYPDSLLDQAAPANADPENAVIARETIELAFIAAIQFLPARQRAVLILRDVLGWPAAEAAEALELTLASTTSALQRARATLRQQLPADRLDWDVAERSAAERDLLERFVDAHERADSAASIALMRADIRVTMPPSPTFYDGREQVTELVQWAFGVGSMGDWRLVITSANRLPAAAAYLRRPGEFEFRAFKLDVIRVADGGVAEITTFDASLFDHFKLPPTLQGESS
ncbi:RNA polymerase subunit sigma-70 [Jatrophihabitans sp. DSM 45814]